MAQIASNAFNFITLVLKSRDLNSIWVFKLITYSKGENFSTVLCTLQCEAIQGTHTNPLVCLWSNFNFHLYAKAFFRPFCFRIYIEFDFAQSDNMVEVTENWNRIEIKRVQIVRHNVDALSFLFAIPMCFATISNICCERSYKRKSFQCMRMR